MQTEDGLMTKRLKLKANGDVQVTSDNPISTVGLFQPGTLDTTWSLGRSFGALDPFSLSVIKK